MTDTSDKIAGIALRRVHETGLYAMRGAPEQPPECNAQRVGRAQGVNNSARPRAGAAGARGVAGPEPAGRARARRCTQAGGLRAQGCLPSCVWLTRLVQGGRVGSHVSFEVLGGCTFGNSGALSES